MREPGHNSLECRSQENLHLAVLSHLVLGARAKETVVTLTGLPPPMSVGRAQCCPYYLVEAPRDWLDYIQFLLDPGLIIALSYPSITTSLAVLIFFKVVTWISLSC